jgi:NADPH:quinone reductase-like Zn-dependent oxidoreductase
VRVAIEQTFPLEEVQQAHLLSESGHARGKIILTVSG